MEKTNLRREWCAFARVAKIETRMRHVVDYRVLTGGKKLCEDRIKYYRF